jgi:peptidoglycan/LPS O-acetylase OafA/YrhL
MPQVQGLRGAVCGLPAFLWKRLIRLQPPYFAACVLALGLNWLSTLAPGYAGQRPDPLPQALSALLSDYLYLTGLLGGSWILVVAWSLQGCLKVDSGAVFGDLNTTQREHPLDVMRQRTQTASY